MKDLISSAPGSAVIRLGKSEAGVDLEEVLPPEPPVLSMASAFTFQGSVDGLERGSESLGSNTVDVLVPEAGSCSPSDGRVICNLVWVLDQPVVSVEVVGAVLVVVVPSELEHSSTVVDFVCSSSLVAGVSSSTGIHVRLAVNFLRVLESNGLPDSVGEEERSLVLVADGGFSEGVDEPVVVGTIRVSALGLSCTVKL